MAPPWASTTALQMARPMPVDWLPRPVRNGSKMSASSSGATPLPSSATTTSTVPARSLAATVTVPPLGEWRAAFSSRLASAWPSWW